MKAKCPHCGGELELQARKPMPAKFDHDQAVALLRFGATVAEVAETFGVSKQAIYDLKRSRLAV